MLRLKNNKNALGVRNQSMKEGKGKPDLLVCMNSYYQKVYNELPAEEKDGRPESDFIPSAEEMSNRYNNSYNCVKTFVEAQILPSSPQLSKWTDITLADVRELYSVMIEDFVDKQFGHRKHPSHPETTGLPLFCVENYRAVTFFIGQAISSFVRPAKAKKNIKIPKTPVIGGVSFFFSRIALFVEILNI